jgi:hypothetical protein
MRQIISGLKESKKGCWTRFKPLRAWLYRLAVVSLPVFAAVATANSPIRKEKLPPSNQVEEYNAEVPKTILELQQFRQTNSISIRSNGGREGVATLVNLNPAINVWYLLKVSWKNGSPELNYHLENPKPQVRRLLLDEKYPSGVVIEEGNKQYRCDLFGADPENALNQASGSQLIFAPLCERRLYLRNPAKGHRTSLEVVTDFLRDEVWGGEEVIVLVRHLTADTHRETGKIEAESQTAADGIGGGKPSVLPLPAQIDSKYADRLVVSDNLGISFEGPARNGMIPGEWYAASGNPGIYVSMIEPNLIASVILQSDKTLVNNLDRVEGSALCYLVAFDLNQFELAYALGTEHPRVEWSDHILSRMKDPKLPGPDGIGSIAPLISTGLIRPWDGRRTVAAFTGGYKRTHGAFKYGELAMKNHGSHYGFMENGVVFSKLQPGLATILVLQDGSMEMKTWGEADNKLLPRIKHARQNGVPLVEFDEASQSSVPGRLVANWGAGNWSGSEDVKLRTLRAGAALQKNHGKRFLIYALFSDATPSAMARVFQAYQCHYAMLLDMNALELTYLAVYRRSGSQFFIDHLVKGMSQVEKSAPGGVVPRFLGYPDNRDFFYLMRRVNKGVKP